MRRILEYFKKNFLNEQSQWILFVPVLFGTGIGLYFSLPVEPHQYTILYIIEFLLLLIYLWRFNTSKMLFAASLLIVALGFCNIELRTLHQEKNISFQDKKEVTYLTGRIIEMDSNSRGKTRLLLDDVSDFEKNRKGLYKITLSTNQNPFKINQCVELAATLMPPLFPVLPNGYQFNRKAFFDGISATGYANSTAFVVDCDQKISPLQKFSNFIGHIRDKIVNNINRILPPDEAGIAAAIVAGERQGISEQITQNYRDSGLAHFLSISGLHMGMIAALTFFLIRHLAVSFPFLTLKYDSKKIAACFAIVMSFVYLLLSGAAIPSQRAFIMTSLVLTGILFNRRAISMRMVSFAALAVLIISPQALISVSFQMSFAAVVALIAFYERYASSIHAFFKGKNFIQIILAYIAGILISDFVASLATLPFAVYHFNRIALYTTLGNFLAGPIIAFVIMPFVLLALLFMPFGLYAWPLKIVGYGIFFVNKITAYVAHLPNAGYAIVSLPLWGLILILCGGLWLCLWQKSWRRLGLPVMAIGILSIFFVQKPDVLYDSNGSNIALKDKTGNLIIMPTRQNTWLKKIWLEKTVSHPLSNKEAQQIKNVYKGLETIPSLELTCSQNVCTYKNTFTFDRLGHIRIGGIKRDTTQDQGGAIYIDAPDQIRIQTVRDTIGFRPWNKN